MTLLVLLLPESICSLTAMQIMHCISQHSKFNQDMSSLICTDMHWWTGLSRSMTSCLSNDHQFWRRNGAIPLLFYSICFIICSQEYLFFHSFSGFPFIAVTCRQLHLFLLLSNSFRRDVEKMCLIYWNMLCNWNG